MYQLVLIVVANKHHNFFFIKLDKDTLIFYNTYIIILIEVYINYGINNKKRLL